MARCARHYPAMALPGSDEPASISHEEARQELFGHGPSRVGMEIYEVAVNPHRRG
jgi:hypothetical protein